MTGQTGRLVRIAELEIDADQLDAYTALLKEEIEASVAREPGVLMLHAMTIRDNPTQFRIVEIYADQQAYEAHLQTPHFLKYKTESAAMVTSLTLIETDPVILCAKPAL
jgi:quinol monooxygenase YgiN